MVTDEWQLFGLLGREKWALLRERTEIIQSEQYIPCFMFLTRAVRPGFSQGMRSMRNCLRAWCACFGNALAIDQAA
jgi:hypothetical protein